jgi:hypothetical protein
MSQSEAMLSLGKGPDNNIVCHKVKTQKDMGKAREANPIDEDCPNYYNIPCKLVQGTKYVRHGKEHWNLERSEAMTSLVHRSVLRD